MTINAVYDALAARIRLLLAGVGQLLTAREREQVTEFIEVNELGVALETLIGYLVEGRHPISRQDAEDTKRLADDMKLGNAFLNGLMVRAGDESE